MPPTTRAKPTPRYCRKKRSDGRPDDAYVRVPDPGTGKPKTIILGRYGTTESRRRYQQELERWRRAVDPQAEGPTMNDLMLAVLRYLKRERYSDSEISKMKTTINLLVPLVGTMPVDQFDRHVLESIREQLVARGRSHGGIVYAIAEIREVFSRGEAIGFITDLSIRKGLTLRPLRRGRAPRSKIIETIPLAHLDRVMAEIAEPWRSMIELQRLTAMRPKEVCRLEWSEIDRASEKPLWLWAPPEHKTAWAGKDKRLYFGARAQKILQRQGRRAHGYIFATSRSAGITPIPRGSYTRAVERCCDRLGLEPSWSPNQIRHTVLTEIERSHPEGLRASQAIAGHASLDTTQIYAKGRDDLARQFALSEG